MKTNKPIFALFFALSFFPQQTETISTTEVAKHVRFLASDELKGRRSGTPEADVAARYIASEFVRLGLEPMGVAEESGKGFGQPFEISMPPIIGESGKIEWRMGDVAMNISAITLPFSSPGKVEGPGKMIDANTLGKGEIGAEFAKSVLFVEIKPEIAANPHGARLRQLAMKAKQSGVAALIFFGNLQDAARKNLTLEGSADAEIPVVWMNANMTVPPNAQVTVSTDIRREKKMTRNVLGVIPGKSGSKEYVVIGAHYDHLGLGGESSLSPESTEIHHGADDNASGTAGLLEIAKLLADQKGKLNRNILFAAFSGEEEGLLGSAHFVKNPPVPLEQIVAMLNLDMVGRLKEGKLDLGGVGTTAKLKEIVEKANATVNLKLKYTEGALGFGGSDHLSFYQKNIPALFFFTGLHSDYHKPTDTAEKINFEGILQISELAAGIAKDIASSAEPMPFTKPKEPERKAGKGGIRAYLGTIPEYGDSDDGLHISGTSGGSPAEKAGLKQGDIITKIGKVDVRSIYDLTFALEEYKPGDEVEVEYIRDKEKKKLKLTLGSR